MMIICCYNFYSLFAFIAQFKISKKTLIHFFSLSRSGIYILCRFFFTPIFFFSFLLIMLQWHLMNLLLKSNKRQIYMLKILCNHSFHCLIYKVWVMIKNVPNHGLLHHLLHLHLLTLMELMYYGLATLQILFMMRSQFLEGLKCESQTENNGKAKSRGHSLARNTQRGRRACWSSRMGLGRIDKLQLPTRTCTKPTQSGQCIVEAFLVLGRATCKLDTQDSPQPRLGGSHHLPPYSIFCSSP